MISEDGTEQPDLPAGAAESAEHFGRLGRLVEEQADDLALARATLREITALCDLADWSSETAGDGSAAAVLVQDLRRVLAGRRVGLTGS